MNANQRTSGRTGSTDPGHGQCRVAHRRLSRLRLPHLSSHALVRSHVLASAAASAANTHGRSFGQPLRNARHGRASPTQPAPHPPVQIHGTSHSVWTPTRFGTAPNRMSTPLRRPLYLPVAVAARKPGQRMRAHHVPNRRRPLHHRLPPQRYVISGRVSPYLCRIVTDKAVETTNFCCIRRYRPVAFSGPPEQSFLSEMTPP